MRQDDIMPGQSHTFVLVHGAWHGGWCWRRVVDLLTAQGHKVFAPTLTGLCERSHLMSKDITLQTHADDIVNLVKWEGLENICLVGHSYGGMPISLAAEALGDKISSFVFLDAFCPEDGEEPLDVVPAARGEEIRAAIARGEVSSVGPPAAWFRVNAADQAWVDSKCTPQPNGVWIGKMRLTGARERIGKKSYIRAGLYPNPIFDAHMEKCRSRGWRVMTANAGHDVMVDAPNELARMLVDVA
jgi:pimeloyl-ACP methyl ester carboxylesterase